MADSSPPADPSPPAPNGDAAPEAGAPDKAPQAARPPRGRPAARPWQGGRFRPTTGRGAGPAGRLRAIVILSAIVLVLVGAIAAWLRYPAGIPQPYFVPIVIDQYGDRDVPVAPWAEQDRTALRSRAWQTPNTFNDQELRLLKEELGRLGRDQPTDQPLIVYLRAYALPTADDDLAVLPGDARLDDDSPGLSLREVCRLLKACPSQKRLLLLDVMQPFADARAGVLMDDAAARAESVVQDALKDDPTLRVLCACSPGQTSLASEEMGHTVFVHYLIEGLSGKADGWDGTPDNRVSVRELAGFVKANVDRWAWHNRRVHQTPVLLGPSDPDFALTAADAPPPDKEVPLDPDYPAALKAAWDLRDGWLADATIWTPPALYRRLEDATLRAEEQWRAGVPLAKVQEDLTTAIDGIKSRRKELTGAAGVGEPDSLALAVKEGKQPPAKPEVAVDQLTSLAALHARTRLPKDPTMPDPAAQLDMKAKALQKDYENKPFELSWLVFQAAKENPSTRPEELAFWLSLLHAEGKPVPDYAEIHVLEQLAKLEIPNPKDAPNAAADWKDAVASLLGLTEAAEHADAEWELLPPLPDALADYLGKWRKEAAGRLQAAKDLLLKGKPADRRAAQKALDIVRTDARGFAELGRELRRLREALRCRDDAFRLLPGFAENGAPSPRGLAEWRKAVEQEETAAKQARALADRLANPDNLSPKWFLDTETQTGTLRATLDTLGEVVSSQRMGSLIAQSPQSTGADAEDMRVTLRLPALSAPDRLKLWSAWRALAGRLHEESAAPQNSPGESASAEPAAEAAEDGLLRARAALAVLTLEGADVTQLEEALQQAPHAKDEKAALRDLGRELRKRLEETRSR